jgi:RNA polymerase sigma-70 factor (ECF subfamily)
VVTRSSDAARMTDAIAVNSIDLLHYFERRVELRDDAADLLAETMMTGWRRVGDLPADEEGARMWLFTIARNVLGNADRTERRRWRLANRLRVMLEPSDAPGADAGSEVRDAVARLDPELGELIRLVHWDGFTVTQAAAILGIPASTARTRHQRAKQELRVALHGSARVAREAVETA